MLLPLLLMLSKVDEGDSLYGLPFFLLLKRILSCEIVGHA